MSSITNLVTSASLNPNLGPNLGGVFLPPMFNLNNSETVNILTPDSVALH